MKTNVIMKRKFYDSEISQRSKDGFFNATEMLQRFNEISNKKLRFKEFWENKGTKEFSEVLENELRNSNGGNSALLQIVETKRGNNGSTWMHPYLFVKFAMWLSPQLEVQIIKWVYDNLIEIRLQSGDHYLEMCKAIAERYEDFYGKKADPLIFVKEAHFLNQLVFNNPNGNQRDIASVEELELMNKLQLANTKMIYEGVPKQKRYENLSIFANLFKK